jgi:hypothetical protein
MAFEGRFSPSRHVLLLGQFDDVGVIRMLKGILFGAAALAAFMYSDDAQAMQTGQECRVSSIVEGGKAKKTTLCKDASGQWVARAPANGGSIDPNFRGKVVYEGQLEGVEYPKTGGNRRGDTLGGLIGSALKLDGKPYHGTIRYELEFDSNLVSGTWQMSDGRRSANGTVSGTRTGDQCQLVNEVNGTVVGICNASSLDLVGKSAPGASPRWESKTIGTATEVVDYVVRDRELAVQRAEQAAQAEQARLASIAERKALKAALPRGADARYRPLLESAVLEDSRYWAVNKYRTGSVDLVGTELDKPSGKTFLKAYFTYSNGQESMVGAIMSGNKVECLQFADEGRCRGVGQGSGPALMGALIQGLMTPPGGGGGGTGYGSDADYQRYEQNCRSEGKTPGNC